MRFSFKIIAIILLSYLIFNAEMAADDTPHPANGYHNYSSLTKALKDLSDQNKKITRLFSIGQTLKGRDLWMLQISGERGLAPQEKQALLICGNAEGDHVIGSEVALGIADYLIKGYGKIAEVTDILDKRTFYIVPRLNPDGAEIFFEKTLLEHPGNLKPRDEDYDWLVDEDGAEDLNGDGVITLMRVKDKKGDWYIDPKDSRLMRKKEKTTSLDSLYQLYPEGIDNDGDEKYNEDGAGGFNINRNFPHNFGYDVKGWGVYPASEQETRALIDFMNRFSTEQQTQPHKNICAVLSFSKYDNLAAEPGIECGKPEFPVAPSEEDDMPQMVFQFGRRDRGSDEQQRGDRKDPQPKKAEDDDMPLFKKVSEQYKKITGIESAVSDKPVGSLYEWTYFQYGVPSFSANLWSLRKEKKESADTSAQKPDQPESVEEQAPDKQAAMRQRFAGRSPGMKPGDSQVTQSNDQQWLRWVDKQNSGKGFVTWEKFQHKQLGEIEIGGFHPYLRINPPVDQIEKLAETHAKFAIFLAQQFADIRMEKPEIEKLSSNLFRIKIKIHNDGEFPFATAMGQKSRNITPIMVQLKFEDDENMKLFGGSKREDIRTIEAKGEKELKWVIISPPGKKIDVTLWARNGGGSFQETVVLK
ncbi:MAG: M14 family metallopeptidase [bacterium]|nr:M14 family metallopeptidase [bacterium]